MLRLWFLLILFAITVNIYGQEVHIVCQNENRKKLFYSMDMCDCEMTEIFCDSLGDAVLGFGCSFDISYAVRFNSTLDLTSVCCIKGLNATGIYTLRPGCQIFSDAIHGSRYPIYAMCANPAKLDYLTLGGANLYLFDNIIHKFYDVGSFVTDTIESMTYVGDRLIGLWKNEIVEVDQLDPSLSKVLFTLPCTKAELPGIILDHTMLKLVSYPTECGEWVVYLINFNPTPIGQIKRGFSRLDLNTGELIYTCTPKTHFFYYPEGQTMLPDTLPCIELALDPDMDDSAGRPPLDYDVTGICPPFDLSVVDVDLLVRATGRDPDSVVLVLEDDVEGSAEFLTAQGGTQHVRGGIPGDRLVLKTDGMAEASDFQQALGRVHYRYDSRCPVAGTRKVTIVMYACRYSTDTATVYIHIPELGCAGRDTTIDLCDDMDKVLLDDLLGKHATKDGHWSIPSGVFDPSKDSSTVAYYVVDRGACPADSAAIGIELGETPVFDLGPDTVICDNDKGYELGTSRKADQYQWSTGGRGPTISILRSGSYSLTLTNAPGCSYADTVEVTLSRDTVIDMGVHMICEGDSVAYWGGYLRQSGVYRDTFSTVEGCDSILRIEVVKRQLPGFDLGADTTLCEGTMEYVLDPGLKAVRYTWQDGSKERVYRVHSSGVYWVEVEDDNGCRYRDSIRISFGKKVRTELGVLRGCEGDSIRVGGKVYKTPGVYEVTLTGARGCDSVVAFEWAYYPVLRDIIRGDSLACEGDTVSLSVHPELTRWSWSNGATGAQIQVTETAQIGLSGIDQNGCKVEALMEVRFLPAPILDIVSRDETCLGEEDGIIGILPPGQSHGALHYELNGAALDSLTVGQLPPGRYQLRVTDAAGCSAVRWVEILPGEEVEVSLGDDIYITTGDTTLTVTASISSNGAAQIEWRIDGMVQTVEQDEITLSNIEGEKEICVEVTDSMGCSAEDCLVIYLERSDKVFIPNVFTPNGDKINDRFVVFGMKGAVQVEALSVFDRWGEEVYRQTHLELNGGDRYWDGKHQGKDVLPGVYVYVLDYRLSTGERQRKVGTVTLVR